MPLQFGLTDDISDKNIKAEIANYKIKVREYKENTGSKREVMDTISEIKNTFNNGLKAHHKSIKGLEQKLVKFVKTYDYTDLPKDLKTKAFEAMYGQNDLFGADLSIVSSSESKAEMLKKIKLLNERAMELENGIIFSDAFEWRFEFPEVLDENGEFVGFDAVIANPPYIDSEKMVKEGHENLREYCKENYSCAVGNWDLYIVFMELAMNIMKKTGTMSYITPDKWISKPFGDEFRRQYINGINHVIMLGRDVFESALVDSIITQVSHAPSATVIASSLNNGRLMQLNEALKENLKSPYFLDPLLSEHYVFIESLEKRHGRLDSLIACESACATADAYKLKPFVKDCTTEFDRQSHYAMVNTGTLGKYVSRWGVKPMTYLKDKYAKPVVNRKVFEANFTNTYKTKSEAKKIIVKGLTLLDATLDLRGELIAGKTTLILTSSDDDVLKYTCAILNSPLSIFYIKAKFGSASYNGGINFTKEMINSIPLPIPVNNQKKQNIIKMVESILERKSANCNADIADLESAINGNLYELYGLLPEEIAIVEGMNLSSYSEEEPFE